VSDNKVQGPGDAKEQAEVEAAAAEDTRKIPEFSGDTATAATEDEPSAPATEDPEGTPAAAPPAQTTRRGSSFVAWLALLLVLALAGAAAWSIQQAMNREASLQQRLAELESVAPAAPAARIEPREQVDIDALRQQWRRDLNNGLEQALQGTLDETRGQLSRQAQILDALQSQLAVQREQLASFSASDQKSWLRAEVHYLLRLANQRLIMARDVDSALALLNSADRILNDLDDASLYDVRAAVASEMAALRAMPRVDVEGTYLRLSALVEQAGRLRIFQLPEAEAQPLSEEPDDWRTRLERGYEEAARKLSDYIVIRRRDVPMEALMDPQWEGLVRQNLRMLLEQAQVALLSRNQTLYRESLQRAQHWVAQFFDTDESRARAMSREITQLESLTVETDMPDLVRSLQAMDKATQPGSQQGGAG